jgi:hypothetical protein
MAQQKQCNNESYGQEATALTMELAPFANSKTLKTANQKIPFTCKNGKTFTATIFLLEEGNVRTITIGDGDATARIPVDSWKLVPKLVLYGKKVPIAGKGAFYAPIVGVESKK